MLTAKKVRLIVHDLQADPKKLETLIRWMGGRVECELDMIFARALQYSSYLSDQYPKSSEGAEVQRRKWGTLVAAHDLRERCPHNSQYLSKRDKQRKERRGRAIYAGWSTSARVESDFEKIAAMVEDGMTYQQAANEIARLNPTKYFRHKPSADVIRKVLKRMGFKKKKPPAKGG